MNEPVKYRWLEHDMPKPTLPVKMTALQESILPIPTNEIPKNVEHIENLLDEYLTRAGAIAIREPGRGGVGLVYTINNMCLVNGAKYATVHWVDGTSHQFALHTIATHLVHEYVSKRRWIELGDGYLQSKQPA